MSFNKVTKIWRSPELVKPIYNRKGNLGQILVNNLILSPAEVCQISAESDVRVTCQEMRFRSIRAAEYLRRLGFNEDSMFGIAGRNSEHVAPMVIASLLLETPLAIVHFDLTKAEMRKAIEMTKPQLMFCDSDVVDQIKEIYSEMKLEIKIIVLDRKVDGLLFVEELFEDVGGNDIFFLSPIRKNDISPVACIISTSGTTGAAKGVCLSHEQLLGQSFPKVFEEKEIHFAFTSLAWFSGYTQLYLPLLRGGIRVITTQEESPELLMEIISKYQVNCPFSAPFGIIEAAKSPTFDTADLSSVLVWSSSGGKIPESVLSKLKAKMPDMLMVTFYTASELSKPIAMSLPWARENAVGQVTSNTEIKIVDRNGNGLDLGKTGEILIRIDPCFVGYYNQPDATKEVIDKDGWYHSGDLGYLDEDGFLYIVDRIKIAVRYNNYSIWPNVVEPIVESIPGVRQVCLVGVPHPDHGDLPTLFVVRELTSMVSADDIHKVISNKFSDAFKLRGGIYFIEKFPITVSQKIARVKVKEMAIKFYKEALNGINK